MFVVLLLTLVCFVEAREPGTLLLNMLIKDEEDHLDRTLPHWAKIIDYWVIGVDNYNTDGSEEVIMKHLSHIPGAIVYVEFDGMGPTWTQLVEYGLEHYPEATHGIIADADFKPMQDHLDKMQLDVRCSKHMYTIWTEDHTNNRKMDWIYRNIPGARVERRVHQTVKVPELPDQEVFQTMIDLHIEEQTGGYQDRTGKKMLTYIEWLEKDLIDYPDDPRTLYYLGYSHFDIFLANKDNPTPYHWEMLKKSVEYYKRRGAATDGNFEEGWFALLKLGEIYERFYNDWENSFYYYNLCADQDPERADPWFYIGQYYRLHNQPEKALVYFNKAASLPIPDRSLFNWRYLYECLTKVDFARAAERLDKITFNVASKALRFLLEADCDTGGAPEEINDLERLTEKFSKLFEELKQPAMTNLKLIQKVSGFLQKRKSRIMNNLSAKQASEFWKPIGTFLSASKSVDDLTCHQYRLLTTPFIRFFKSKYDELEVQFKDDEEMFRKLSKLSSKLRKRCR